MPPVSTHRPPRRFFGGFVCFTALAAILAGCGAGPVTSAPSTTEAARPGAVIGGEVDPFHGDPRVAGTEPEVLAFVLEQAANPRFRFDTEATIELDDGSTVRSDSSGTVAGSNLRLTADLAGFVPVADQWAPLNQFLVAEPVEFIAVGSQSWIRSAGLLSRFHAEPDEWLILDPADGGALDPSAITMAGFDLVDALDDIDPRYIEVTTMPTETLDGRAIAHHQLQVDLAAAAEGSATDKQAVESVMGGASTAGLAIVDLWTDGDGNRWRIRASFADPSLIGGLVSVDPVYLVVDTRLADHDEALSVARPPSEITSAELIAQAENPDVEDATAETTELD